MSGWTAIGLRLAPWDHLSTRERGPIAEAEDRPPLPTPRGLSGALRTAILRAQGFDFASYERMARSRWGADVSSGLGLGPNPGPEQNRRDLLREAGAAEETLNAVFRGPWLALAPDANSAIEPLLPTPAVLVRAIGPESGLASASRWGRADPWEGSLPGWDEEESPLWRRDGPERARYPGGYLTPSGISTFLAGNCPNDSDWWSPEALYSSELISARPSASEGRAAIANRLTTLRSRARANPDRGQSRYEGWRVVLYAEVWAPDVGGPFARSIGRLLENEIITLGRGGRGLTATVLPQPFEWSALEPSIRGLPSSAALDPRSASHPLQRSLWLLTTAAPCASGAARPQDLAGWFGPDAAVRSAASGPPLTVTGWDSAPGRPIPIRRALPAGSVLHVLGPIDFPSFESGPRPQSEPDSRCDDGGGDDHQDRAPEPASALSPPICVGPDPEDRAQGWGQVLRGAWREACP